MHPGAHTYFILEKRHYSVKPFSGSARTNRIGLQMFLASSVCLLANSVCVLLASSVSLPSMFIVSSVCHLTNSVNKISIAEVGFEPLAEALLLHPANLTNSFSSCSLSLRNSELEDILIFLLNDEIQSRLTYKSVPVGL